MWPIVWLRVRQLEQNAKANEDVTQRRSEMTRQIGACRTAMVEAQKEVCVRAPSRKQTVNQSMRCSPWTLCDGHAW